jgi:hypothetical protein
LQSMGLSVWFTKKQTKERGIKQYYITRANGYLSCAIIECRNLGGHCQNECSYALRESSIDNNVVGGILVDDGWRCCPICSKLFCYKLLCKARLAKHMTFCRVNNVRASNLK